MLIYDPIHFGCTFGPGRGGTSFDVITMCPYPGQPFPSCCVLSGASAPQLVKPQPGVLLRCLITAPGTSGALVLNDAASLALCNPSNVIAKIVNGQTVWAGSVRFQNGLCVSGVPSPAPVSFSAWFV